MGRPTCNSNVLLLVMVCLDFYAKEAQCSVKVSAAGQDALALDEVIRKVSFVLGTPLDHIPHPMHVAATAITYIIMILGKSNL